MFCTTLIELEPLVQEYHDKTCIRFRPRTSEQAYIHIMKEINRGRNSVLSMCCSSAILIGRHLELNSRHFLIA